MGLLGRKVEEVFDVVGWLAHIKSIRAPFQERMKANLAKVNAHQQELIRRGETVTEYPREAEAKLQGIQRDEHKAVFAFWTEKQPIRRAEVKRGHQEFLDAYRAVIEKANNLRELYDWDARLAKECDVYDGRRVLRLGDAFDELAYRDMAMQLANLEIPQTEPPRQRQPLPALALD